jgi:hypothetical protein
MQKFGFFLKELLANPSLQFVLSGKCDVMRALSKMCAEIVDGIGGV